MLDYEEHQIVNAFFFTKRFGKFGKFGKQNIYIFKFSANERKFSKTNKFPVEKKVGLA